MVVFSNFTLGSRSYCSMHNQYKELERQNWQRRTKHNLKRKGKKYNPDRSSIKARRVLGAEYIDAPIALDLYNESNRDLTLEFIELIEKHSSERRVFLNFSLSESISAAALLLLYATIDTILNTEGSHLIRLQKLSGKVKMAVELSGLKALTLNQLPLNFDGPLPVIKGSARGEEFEAVIDYVQHQIFKNGMTPEQENIWATAVIETVSNVKLHAYADFDNKPWWILCSVIDGDLYLAICDKGVGIPNTIREQTWINDILARTPSLLQRFVNNSDSEAIELSMIVGETSTKAEKHGLGSKSIQALVDENPNGALWVFSNKGVYSRIDHDKELKDFSRSISGTLVQWNIKLNYE